MARPIKTGLDYFPLDCQMDEKIKILESVHGNDGFAWMIKTWQKAYQSDGLINLNGSFGVFHAENSRITTGKQMDIVSTCVEVGLLVESSPNIYTSNGIQKRLESIEKLRNLDRKRKNSFPDGKPPENPRKTGESKVKKSKVNKIAFVAPSFEEFKAYCIENGYGCIAEKAFRYYDVAGWKDSGGCQVMNWKQKLIAVWFKPENKDKPRQPVFYGE